MGIKTKAMPRTRKVSALYSFRLPHDQICEGPSVAYRTPKSKQHLYSGDDERVDAVATKHIREALLEIHKKQDGEQAYLLLAGFFVKHPVENLGPRATAEIARSLSKGRVHGDNFKFLLDSLERALVYHRKAEVLCDKLRHVGFPQTKNGLRRAHVLHLVLGFWEKDLLKVKKTLLAAAA